MKQRPGDITQFGKFIVDVAASALMPGVHRRFQSKPSREALNCRGFDAQHFLAQPGIQCAANRVALNATESLQDLPLQVLVDGDRCHKLP